MTIRFQNMIDMNGMCTFCLGTADANIIYGDDDSLYSFKDCWSHFRGVKQTESETGSNPPIFLIKGRMSEVPPMCKVCIIPAKEVGVRHQEIKQLEEKLVELREQLDEAVKVIKRSIAHSHLKKDSVRLSKYTIKFLQTLIDVDDTSCDFSAAAAMQSTRNPVSDFNSHPERIPIFWEPEDEDKEAEEVEAKVKTEVSSDFGSDRSDCDGDSDYEAVETSGSYSESESELEMEVPSPKRRRLQSSSNDPLDVPRGKSKMSINHIGGDGDSGGESRGNIEVNDNPKKRSSRRNKLPRSGRLHNAFNCMICRERITLETNYEHMRTHVGDYVYQCPWCNIAFPSRYSPSFVEKHYSKDKILCKKAPPRKILCEVCNEDITGGIVTVAKHLDKHETSEKKYTCPLPSCDASFTHRQNVEHHIGFHDTLYLRSIKAQSRKRKERGKGEEHNFGHRYHPCEFCGESISKSTILTLEHMQTHVGDYAYQCPGEKCGQVFLCRYSRACCDSHKIHRRKCKLPPPQIKCDTCGFQFSKSAKLQLQQLGPHLKRHETLEKNFDCPVNSCRESFTTRQSVEFHLRSHEYGLTQEKGMQVCSLCEYTTVKPRMTPIEMEAHLGDVHQVNDSLKCKESDCSYVFPNQEELLQHKISHHMKSSGKVKCDLCDTPEVFTFARTMRNHYFKEHQIGSKLLCEFCDRSFSSVGSLRKHIQSAHEEDNRPYKCDASECGRAFSHASSLEAHNIREHGAEPLKCKFCSATFNVRNKLLDHEKFDHLGVEKPTFTCPTCSAVLSSRKSLKFHLQNVHRDPSTPDLKCPECDKVFKSEYRRAMHVRHIHEQDPSLHRICDLCGKTLKGQKQLKTHMLIHTGERPYECSLCGMRFRQHASLFNHNKTHKRMGDKFVPKKTFDRTPR